MTNRDAAMARICMVAYTDYRTDTRVRREAEALVARGDKVIVISLAPFDGRATDSLNGVCLKPVRLKRYRGSSPISYLCSYLAFFFMASARLNFLHLRMPFHVVQVHTLPDFMVFTALIPKLLGARVILDVHDLTPELYRSKFGLGEAHPFIRLLTWIERQSIAFADRAIAVHKPHLEALVRHGNPEGKFIVLLNLPDPALFSGPDSPQSETEGGKFLLIYHGTLSHRHGLHILLQTMAILGEEVPGLKLLVIGDGDGFPYLARRVEELRLSEKVSFKRGFFPPEEIIPLIRAADAGVVPILADEFTRYMLPVKLLEYVALGLPAICARTGTVQAYFDERMLAYFDPGDPADLAAVIRSLNFDRSWRAELCTLADRFNREYAWEQHKSNYLQLIDDLCESRGRNQGRRIAAGKGVRRYG